DAQLDRYAAAWLKDEAASCRATRLERTQSEDLHALSESCFKDELLQLRAPARILGEADVKVASRAVGFVSSLPNTRLCTEAHLLAQRVSVPPPDKRESIDRVRELLAEAKALRDGGRYKDALPRAQDALREANAVDFLPLRVEALVRVGIVK